MSLRLSALKINIIKIFIVVIFVFFAVLKDENRLLLKINKMFARLFFIKGFFEFDFLREIMIITIQFINLIKKILYMLILYR